MMRTDYDVVVAGVGMVGAVFALACAREGLRVAVIERQELMPQPDEKFDLRVSAITLASRAIFENLGLWQEMPQSRIGPLREMYVWDSLGSGAVHFDAADLGEADLGYIIENRLIVEAARAQLALQAGITLICPATPVGFSATVDAAEVWLADGTVLRTLLVVGADGADSHVRELAGITIRGWSYGQVAIVATVKTDRPHNHVARQIFLPTGPLAFLPLADPEYFSIVWSCDTQRANCLLGLDDSRFLQALKEAIGTAPGEILSIGRHAGFPLSLGHATRYVDERVALVGDAAHRVHPLAGQGVNLGLLDAATLAEVIVGARRSGRDIGALRVLRGYERWRRGGNLAMLAVTDAFKRGFGSDDRVIRQLRNIGLTLADRLTPVKRQIMQRAMGLAGDLPQLAKNLAR